MGRHKTEGSLALQEKKVIVIDSVEKPELQKLRVAAYARVSSDSSDQLNSFMAQTRYYTGLITSRENWTMADIYADEGITGTSAEKRQEFQRMLADCRKGRIDHILVKSISRFARNAKDCLETIRALKAIGVSVYFEEQNIDTSKMSGELMTAMFAAIAQKESESISGNMRWSYKQRMEKGTYLPSSMPYGYIIKDRKIVVEEAQAQIVREIFSSYLSGMNIMEIADKLNQTGIPVKSGNPKHRWGYSAVCYILTNEKYIGNSLWQKTYSTDTFPVKRFKNKGNREQYYAENTHPPIIDADTFLAVQELKKIRGENAVGHIRQHNALNRKIYCGFCGTGFRKKASSGTLYWECRNHNHSRENCHITQVPESEIHAAFLRMYHKLKLHGEPILNELLSNLQTVRERRFLWSVDIIDLNKRISDLTDQEHMLAEMNKHGLVSPDIFISQSNELARQITEAKQKKSRLMECESDDSIPKTQELLESLENMPEYLPDFDEEFFAELVDRITVVDNKHLQFRLKNGLELTEQIERTVR